MPRSKAIPDPAIYASIRGLLASGGDKSVSFASVAKATGLAAPTLVQRFGSRDGMVQAALLAAWDALDAATAAAIDATADKGPQGLLKALLAEPRAEAEGAVLAMNLRDGDLRLRAAGWRATVESALALRLGSGVKARETAALLFAAWQGQALWAAAGGNGFRLKDAVKRLT